MNGTLELGFASDSSTRPYGDFRCMLKVFSSTAFISETKDSSFCPIESLAPQRLIEAMQSSAVTGWPSCHSRSEEHTSELQSLMRISYAVFCLKKKNKSKDKKQHK